MSDDRNEFPFYDEVRVRFRDVDAMGHVNNAVYFTYMETARGAFFQQFFDIQRPADIPVILGEIACRYLAPAYYGEVLRVGLGVSRFGTKSFEMVYGIEGPGERQVATGTSTMVMYDYDRGASIVVPDEFREAVRSFQGAWEPPR